MLRNRKRKTARKRDETRRREKRPFEGPGPRRNLEPDRRKVELAREELESVVGH